jgi:serine/threonine-protein kinase
MLSMKLVAAPTPGTVIGGKYRVERLLGSGGMGAVVAARHVELQQPVAIKVLLPAVAKTEEANIRFLREGRAAAKLTSPYVAKVFDSGRLPSGEPYLVMELLGGRDLRSHLAEVRRVPLAQAVEWVLQAAHALGEAHAQHIVHRDVKPANLFLAETSAGTIVKVLDFGVAKHLDEGGADLTNTASVVGTPRYMAPEQMRSARLADARGDVWSLGVVLYELVTGESPFRGDTVTALCFDVMERTPQPASHCNAELPPTFDALVARCLAKDPDDRFPTMEALAAALRPFAPDARASLPFLPSNAPQPEPSAAPPPATHAASEPTLDLAVALASGTTSPVPEAKRPAILKTLELAMAQPGDAAARAVAPARVGESSTKPGLRSRRASRLPLVAVGFSVGLLGAAAAAIWLVEPARPTAAAMERAPTAAPPSAGPVVVLTQPPAASIEIVAPSIASSAEASVEVPAAPSAAPPVVESASLPVVESASIPAPKTVQPATPTASGSPCSPPYWTDIRGHRRVKPWCQ